MHWPREVLGALFSGGQLDGGAVGALLLNTALTVGIVVLTKLLFTRFGFGFAPTLLLTLHQATCAVGAWPGPSAGRSVLIRGPHTSPLATYFCTFLFPNFANLHRGMTFFWIFWNLE